MYLGHWKITSTLLSLKEYTNASQRKEPWEQHAGILASVPSFPISAAVI